METNQIYTSLARQAFDVHYGISQCLSYMLWKQNLGASL